MKQISNSKVYASTQEVSSYQAISEALKSTPIPDNEILGNLELFLTPASMAKILFVHHIYQKILSVPGNVMEFGTRWGRNAALFSTLRTLYEPFNYYRKIVVFDTFDGFPSVSHKDGKGATTKPGILNVTDNYAPYLEGILAAHNNLAPRAHLSRHAVVVGDVSETLPKYLEDHPETVVSLAYFDIDLYEPTKNCLASIKPHLVKGSILVFDELGSVEYPGETIAIREILGLHNLRLQRWNQSGQQAYCEIA